MAAIPEHLLPTRFPREDVEIVRRLIRVKPGTTPEMVMDPDFWQHAGTSGQTSALRVDDEIKILAIDGSFELHLRVMALDTRGYWAQMRLLNFWPRNLKIKKEWIEPASTDQGMPKIWPDKEGYRIELNAIHKWRVIDRAGAVISRDHPDEATAIAALDEIKREKKEAA